MKTLNDYMSMSYRMEVVEDKTEGGFVVSYPDLPGCITCGETVESAISNEKKKKIQAFDELACIEFHGFRNVTELTGFRSPSEQEQIGRYMQRKYQRSIKFDKVMGISCVIVGFLSAVLSFGNIAAIAVAVAFLIAGFLD